MTLLNDLSNGTIAQQFETAQETVKLHEELVYIWNDLDSASQIRDSRYESNDGIMLHN